ncbi:hypothetical protein JZ751_002443 [Albula glossodonta]|uniref:Consortin C-terminal domain-containing protein n=1 Tax=Albula glossodonta TaxID=121402 RepID=A0A8T2N834_9TELE|nr:hypothetical protein JZ751_002443 [Albula glossodonta]
MEEELSLSEEAVRRGLGGVMGGDLCNSIGCGTLRPPSSDENQNRLQGDDEDETGEDGDGRLQERRQLYQQDSLNNNDEMDNQPCPPNLDDQHKDSSPAITHHNTVTGREREMVGGWVFHFMSPVETPPEGEGVSWGSPSVCPVAGTPNALRDHAVGPPQSGPATSPWSLVESLPELLEETDHSQLPQRLHQIAEAYFLGEDYERALQFVQLEKLYHERLLSNLAVLQEQWGNAPPLDLHQLGPGWRSATHRTDPNPLSPAVALSIPESRRNAGRQHKSRLQGRACADLGSAHLETLTKICRTHQSPNVVPPGSAICQHRLYFTSVCCPHAVVETTTHSYGSAETERLMEEQQAVGEVDLAQGVVSEEKAASTPGHQGAPLCNSDSSHPLVDTPTSPVHADCDSGDSRREGDRDADTEPPCQPGLEDVCRVTPTEGSSLEEGGDWRADADQKGVGSVCTETGDSVGPVDEEPPTGEDTDQPSKEGLEVGEGMEEGNGDVPAEECEIERVGSGVEAVELEGMAESSLDDLAKRIKVEEIAPAPGLVSILKRRASLEGTPSHPPALPKQVPKRKVRFKEPDNGMDQDEVGGDSWLLLLLLCMVTMVISVGGTALYCTFGDARSSVCTDFARNMDFCFGQLQRGVDELRHWLSPGS